MRPFSALRSHIAKHAHHIHRAGNHFHTHRKKYLAAHATLAVLFVALSITGIASSPNKASAGAGNLTAVFMAPGTNGQGVAVDGSTNIATDSQIIFRTSAPLDEDRITASGFSAGVGTLNTMNVSIAPNGGSAVSAIVTHTSYYLDPSQEVYTITPNANLSQNYYYTVSLTGSDFGLTSNSHADYMNGGQYLHFTTAQPLTASATVVSYTGGSSVGLDQTGAVTEIAGLVTPGVRVIFNKLVNSTSATNNTYISYDNNGTPTKVPGSWDFANDIANFSYMSFTPSGYAWQTNTTYSVTVTTNVTDTAGTPIPLSAYSPNMNVFGDFAGWKANFTVGASQSAADNPSQGSTVYVDNYGRHLCGLGVGRTWYSYLTTLGLDRLFYRVTATGSTVAYGYGYGYNLNTGGIYKYDWGYGYDTFCSNLDTANPKKYIASTASVTETGLNGSYQKTFGSGRTITDTAGDGSTYGVKMPVGTTVSPTNSAAWTGKIDVVLKNDTNNVAELDSTSTKARTIQVKFDGVDGSTVGLDKAAVVEIPYDNFSPSSDAVYVTSGGGTTSQAGACTTGVSGQFSGGDKSDATNYTLNAYVAISSNEEHCITYTTTMIYVATNHYSDFTGGPLGGGSGVPEFSTYMYLLTALAGGWIIKKKVEEKQVA